MAFKLLHGVGVIDHQVAHVVAGIQPIAIDRDGERIQVVPLRNEFAVGIEHLDAALAAGILFPALVRNLAPDRHVVMQRPAPEVDHHQPAVRHLCHRMG